MALRRTGDDAEPAAFDPERVRTLAEERAHLDGALMPILHTIQAEFGHIDERALPVVADVLNLTRAEVYGVATFYHDFRLTPAGRHVVRLCRAEACQAAGAEALAAHAEAALGVPTGATTGDGAVTLEAVYCLGLCAVAPSAMIDGRLIGRLDAARLDAELARVRGLAS